MARGADDRSKEKERRKREKEQRKLDRQTSKKEKQLQRQLRRKASSGQETNGPTPTQSDESGTLSPYSVDSAATEELDAHDNLAAEASDTPSAANVESDVTGRRGVRRRSLRQLLAVEARNVVVRKAKTSSERVAMYYSLWAPPDIDELHSSECGIEEPRCDQHREWGGRLLYVSEPIESLSPEWKRLDFHSASLSREDLDRDWIVIKIGAVEISNTSSDEDSKGLHRPSRSGMVRRAWSTDWPLASPLSKTEQVGSYLVNLSELERVWYRPDSLPLPGHASSGSISQSSSNNSLGVNGDFAGVRSSTSPSAALFAYQHRFCTHAHSARSVEAMATATPFSNVVSSLRSMPNTILFEFSDGFYCAPSLAYQFHATHMDSLTQYRQREAQIPQSCGLVDWHSHVLMLSQLRDKTEAEKKKLAGIRRRCVEELEARMRLCRQQARSMEGRMRKDALEEKALEMRVRCGELRREIDEILQTTQSRAASLSDSMQQLQVASSRLTEAQHILQGKDGQGALENLLLGLHARRWQVVQELAEIFPVYEASQGVKYWPTTGSHSVSTGKYAGGKESLVGTAGDGSSLLPTSGRTPPPAVSHSIAPLSIAGMHLRSFSGLRKVPGSRVLSFQLPERDVDNSICTALGYVCLLVQKLGRYLDVPLRYPVAHGASRSYVFDMTPSSTAQDKKQSQKRVSLGASFPLYFEAPSEHAQFSIAVMLLNKNLEQMLNSYQMKWLGPRHTLHNLHRLLYACSHAASLGTQPSAQTLAFVGHSPYKSPDRALPNAADETPAEEGDVNVMNGANTGRSETSFLPESPERTDSAVWRQKPTHGFSVSTSDGKDMRPLSTGGSRPESLASLDEEERRFQRQVSRDLDFGL